MTKLSVVLLGLAALAARAQLSFLYPTNITLDGTIQWIVAGDFNNDGIGDFAVSYQTGASTASVVLFLGSRDGHFVRKNLPQVTTDAGDKVASDVAWAAADVNLDGKLDLVTGKGVLLGNGDGTFQPLIPFGGAPGTAVRPLGIALPYLPLPAGGLVQVADFNNDGIPDLCAAAYDAFVVLLGNGDGTFGPPISTGPLYSSYPYPVDELAVFTLGDFDGDGIVDIAYAGTGGDVSILFGNGDGTFTRVVGVGAPAEDPGALTIGDLRGDGHVDLLAQGDGGVAVWLLNGGEFNVLPIVYPPPSLVPAEYNGPLAMADFDGDKKQDIASYFAIYRGNGNGSLQAPVLFGQEPGLSASYYLPALPYSPPPMVVADVNGDGKPDLIGVGPTLDTITVLINSSGTPVASAPAYQAASLRQLLSPGGIAVVYGTGLSSMTATASDTLQTTLGDTSVEIVDFAGKTILAPLLYVSPTQINFVVPESTAVNGPAIINVIGNGLPKGAHSTLVVPVSAGIFTLDGSGSGTPVASAVRVAPDGTQTPVPTDQPIQIDSTSQVYLSLYGTGFRGASYGGCALRPPGPGSTEVDVTMLYVGPQSVTSVVDQFNIPLPSNTPKGPVNIICTFYNEVLPGGSQSYEIEYFYPSANTVTIMVQ
jgi:uncharacterized protein (TIGR03437 family)